MVLSRLLALSAVALALIWPHGQPSQGGTASSARSVAEQAFRGSRAVITSFLPVTVRHPQRLERAKPIEGAFDPRGQVSIYDAAPIQYFATPISYPYRFSEAGLGEIISALMSVDDQVDRQFVAKGVYETIPEIQFDTMAPETKASAQSSDVFVRFRLHDLPAVTFKVFPSFLVLEIERIEKPLQGFADYTDLVDRWHRSMNDLLKHHDKLLRVLGISRTEPEWRRGPVLTFVALEVLRSVDLLNYLHADGGKNYLERFLVEVSVGSYRKVPPQNWMQPYLFGLDWLTTESPMGADFRQYYSSSSFFGSARLNTVEMTRYQPQSVSEAILRTSTLIYVGVPQLLDDVADISRDIGTVGSELRTVHSSLLGASSKSEIVSLRARAHAARERVRELREVLDETREHLRNTKAVEDFSSDKSLRPEALERFHLGGRLPIDLTRFSETRKRLESAHGSADLAFQRLAADEKVTSDLADRRLEQIEGRRLTLQTFLYPAIGAVIGGLVIVLIAGWMLWRTN